MIIGKKNGKGKANILNDLAAVFRIFHRNISITLTKTIVTTRSKKVTSPFSCECLSGQENVTTLAEGMRW